jgi:hypothetical protein
MSAPQPSMEPTGDSVIPYTNYRIALATAVLGSLGATSAWITLLAMETGDLHVIVTIVVGAVIGLAAHWIEHYIRVVHRERSGEGGGQSAGRHLRKHPWAALLWATTFAFLGLATEHLVAHMVSEFLRPFLASFASLLLAGAIIGWTMSRGRPKDENLIQLVASGLFTGATIGVVTGIVWKIGFHTAPWFALIAWWGLIGIGMRALTRPERNAVRVADPILGVALVFVITFLLNLLPVTVTSYDKLGPLKSLVLTVRTMAVAIQLSPAVPATFWNEAEQKVSLERGVTAATTIEQAPAVVRAPDTPAVRGALHVDVARATDRLTARPGDDLASRWSSLTRARWSELVRSWLVIFLFALGAGFAPQLERRLRPIDYPNSETYRMDIELTVFMVLLLATACAVARFGTHAPSQSHPHEVRAQ